MDSSKYTGDIAYVDVDDSNGFWEFAPSGYAVGDGSVVSASIDAIADTGTTLLYLPTAVVSAYYAQVSGAAYSALLGGYTFPCSATLPDFTLVIGGESRTVPGDYINYSPIIASRCYGGIQRDTGIGFSIVGDIFLKVRPRFLDQHIDLLTLIFPFSLSTLSSTRALAAPALALPSRPNPFLLKAMTAHLGAL